MKRLLTIFLFFVAIAANAQRTLFGRINNYVVPVVTFTLLPTGINPVTNGLILYLDASRTASYGGMGTTWNDISGQSPANIATLVESPSFGSGNLSVGYSSLRFSGSNYANPTSKIFNSVTYTFPVYNDWYMPSILEINKFRAYVWSLHPSRGVYTNYGGNLVYYNGTSGNGNDYAWGKYLSSTMTGQRYKLYYLESGNEDGSAAYNGWTEFDRLVVMPIRSF